MRRQEDGDPARAQRRRRRRHVIKTAKAVVAGERHGGLRLHVWQFVGETPERLLQARDLFAERHDRLDAAGREPALEQLMLIVERAGEKQFAQRFGIVRPQRCGAAVGSDRLVMSALQLQGVAELQMRIGISRRFGEGLAIHRLCLGRPTRILQHVGVLDTDIGAFRRERQGYRIGLRGRRVLPAVAQPVAFADLRLAIRGFCGAADHTRRGRSPSTMIRHKTRLSLRS